ncbi:alpha/beta hydrolase [Herbaspirillum hiltneri N3]|uniref:Alpha/beta hydrolase n=1 Tax=Herbaspirillum hiltneri N3 TaxID=1262470 RepID=A0ABM5V1F7_9BURK|nr:alpha/beta fold hydrolase [Herbaspirillum hiltneri]AKZ63393.1 alpha/beta hydrolase [Herbaspirillum hiltneri N3]
MPFLTHNKQPRIHYDIIDGDPAKPWLVFLHEGLGCTAMWKDFPQRLCAATGCRGLLYDRLGYGLSDALQQTRAPDYLHRYALDELPSILVALLPQQAYILIGHSDGGSIALLHAAQRAPLLRAIVTEAAHVFVEPVTLDGIRAADRAYADGKLKGLQKYHGDKTGQIFKAWSETWLAPAFADWNIEADLPRIACPALVMQGVDDQYGTPAQVDAIVAGIAGSAGGHLGTARPAMLAGCGHSPHQEQPQAVLELMRDFVLEQVAATAA